MKGEAVKGEADEGALIGSLNDLEKQVLLWVWVIGGCGYSDLDPLFEAALSLRSKGLLESNGWNEHNQFFRPTPMTERLLGVRVK